MKEERMYRSILVPLDGSSFGEHALPYALSIARQAQAQLQLAHVHVAALPPSDDIGDAELRAREQAYLEGLVARLQPHWDGQITTMLLDGPIAEVLHDHAVAIKADLIVMTTHGRGALSRFWLGSVADKLVRQAPMPVLLVRPQEHQADFAQAPVFKHILLPLDGSALAEQMLIHAGAIGQLMHADYTLLQAIEPMITAYGTELYGVILDDQALGQLRANAQAYLDPIAARLRAESPRTQTVVVLEQPVTAILDYAKEHAVDLIALETHGRSGFARWLVGGVADKVVRGATVPVLLHRPQSEERAA
jgi:nucleotide-binding universal stress UspA family protein